MTTTTVNTNITNANGSNRYLPPDRLTRRVFNPLIGALTKLGLGVRGARLLAVPGRVSGEIQTTPVNVLSLDGERYLVAPRGVTDWVRNVRAAGGAELRVGRRREQVALVELSDAAKPPVLRAYIRVWRSEVGKFFDGITDDATDEQLLEIAGGYPAFRLSR